MRQLDGRERAVPVHGLAHHCVRRDVTVVPEPRLDVGRHVAARVDLALLGTDHGPAAFRLDFPHGGVRRGHRVTHPVAVGDLEEPVARHDRADAHRFEEYVVPRIPTHGRASASSR